MNAQQIAHSLLEDDLEPKDFLDSVLRAGAKPKRLSPRFIIWLREEGEWVEQGDGPLTQVQAERIAREIRQDFGLRTKILPVGQAPEV